MRLRTLLQLLSGAALLGVLGCVDPTDLDQDGYSPRELDCDDANPSIYPGAKEIFGNTADENCNGQGDADLDGDGFSADGTLGGKPDCDDHRSNTYPGAPESPDGKSQDCDSIPDNHLPGFDDDNDGFSEANGDCNDANPAVSPAAADVENGVDDNCNGTVDEQSPSVDDDKDGLSETEGDCDDLNRTVFPGAPETGFQSGYDGDGLDNNCNGVIDEGTRFFDDDGDGFSENGAVGGRADCNDVNPAVFPGAAENFADGIDSDCDGSIEFDPADGPKPIEFDDGILSPGPSANVAGQYVDAPECKTLSQIISIQPFSPPRVYSLRFISVRDPSIPVSEVDEVGLIGYLIAQANAEFAPFGIQFRQEGVMEVVSSAEHANIVNDNTAGIQGLHDAICEYVCGGCKAGPECDDPNGRIVVLLVESMKSKSKDSNGNPVEIDAAGLGTYPASNYTGIGLDRRAINVKSGTTFAHELGHVFGLLHTHHYAENAALHERVDRTFAQCEMNGDGLCDTPADPHKFACSEVPGPACMPDCKGNADDQGGLWQPDVRNIMSYYHGCDHLSYFSTQQFQLMGCVAEHSAHRKKLKVDGLSTCSVTCCDKESPSSLTRRPPRSVVKKRRQRAWIISVRSRSSPRGVMNLRLRCLRAQRGVRRMK